jgi:integrase
MKKKIILPNGCSMSVPSVYPKNWKSGGKTLLDIRWRIQYYFYPKEGKRKLVVVKGMNNIMLLTFKRELTKYIIQDVIDDNKNGFNPITKQFVLEEFDEYTGLNPHLHFITAFRIALTKIQCSENHRKQMEWCVNRLDKKVGKLKLKNVVIGQLKRRQLKQLLEACDLPNHYYNKYLAYLSRLFGELLEYECCENNLVRDIRKRKIIKKQREILASKDHRVVMSYLYANHYEFWRYAKIFLFSGARTTELFRVQAKDVNIKNQEYKTLIMKGSRPHEVVKVILKEVIPLWTELLANAKPDDYLFSKGLKPGVESILPNQITKRWMRLVKKSEDIRDENGVVIKITADFYSLKHSLLDVLPEDVAMQMASHTNSKTTSLYRVNAEKRKREELKKLSIDDSSFEG